MSGAARTLRRACVVTLAALGPAALVSATRVVPAEAIPSAHTATGSALTACSWPISSGSGHLNVAYPDTSAHYWAMRFVALPDESMTISGRFPLARYMSFTTYHGTSAVDHLTDDAIAPSSGSNPYVVGNRRTSSGTYTIHIVAGDPPAQRAPDTLYTGRDNPLGLIFYRLYLPQGGVTGGVPLPTVSDAGRISGTRAPCAARSASADATPRSADDAAAAPRAADRSLASGAWRVDNASISAAAGAHAHAQDDFDNPDNTYLELAADLPSGGVIAFRARAPTYAHTAHARRMPAAQVRYFSICTNQLILSRVVRCVPDQKLRLDSRGDVNVVISRPADKPAHLSPLENWIPAGSGSRVLVLYRQLLASPGFRRAGAAVTASAAAPREMGAYYPRTVRCSRSAFERNRCGLPEPHRRGRHHRRRRAT